MPLSHLARHALSQWITRLLAAVPIRSHATFAELLCACLVSPEGWVTRAITAICRPRHWTTCYTLLERGHVRTVPLARGSRESLPTWADGRNPLVDRAPLAVAFRAEPCPRRWRAADGFQITAVMPGGAGVEKTSSNGDVLGFYDPATKQAYLVADNIPRASVGRSCAA